MTTKHDPRLAVLRDFTLYVSTGDDKRISILENLDAVDPLRQPVSGGVVEAALMAQWTYLHGDRGKVPFPAEQVTAMARALAAADVARGRDTDASPPTWNAAKERVLRQLAFLQPRAHATDAECKLWSEIRRAAFPDEFR